MIDLSGKTALVCGASQGIGRACAQMFAQAGAQLILLARNQKALEELQKDLPNPSSHIILAKDLRETDFLEEQIEAIQKKQGPIHIALFNTQGPPAGPIVDAKEQDFLAGMELHITVPLRLIKLLLPSMKEASYGRIINIVSTSVKIPIPNLGVSNTIRAAVAGWSKTLSLELAPFGVTVNNILPGYTKTPRLDFLIQSSSKRENAPFEAIQKKWISTIPMGRFADPKEIASLALFLASPLSSYMTGTNIPVDGGRTGSF